MIERLWLKFCESHRLYWTVAALYLVLMSALVIWSLRPIQTTQGQQVERGSR